MQDCPFGMPRASPVNPLHLSAYDGTNEVLSAGGFKFLQCDERQDRSAVWVPGPRKDETRIGIFKNYEMFCDHKANLRIVQ